MNYNNLNLVARIRAGSHLHGYNVESSDEDIYNIYMPNKDDILESFIDEKKQHNKFVSNINGKDETFMRFDKFIFNCLRGSPNSIELLFATGDNVLYKNELWDCIVSNRDKFMGKHLICALFNGAYSLLNHDEMHVYTRYLKDNYDTGFIFSSDEFCKDYDWYTTDPDGNLWFLRTLMGNRSKTIDDIFMRRFPKRIITAYRIIGQIEQLFKTGELLNLECGEKIRSIRETETFTLDNKAYQNLLSEISKSYQMVVNKYTSKEYLDINKFDNYDHELFWKNFIKYELLQQLK